MYIMSSTHFGFQTVDEKDKAKHVRGVFDSVAAKYDVMNDLMSMGLHRAWKAYTIMVSGAGEGSKDSTLPVAQAIWHWRLPKK
jgi:demethylmenaquinone methyltransferase / 2-methoxy-6-polyprenyl-1,4-benzoquinol methylase